MNISDQRIRLAIDVSRWIQAPKDVISSSSVAIANGADIQFELAFSYGPLSSDAQLINPTNWSSVTIQLKDSSPRTGNPYWSETVGLAQMNAALTYANWIAGTDQNLLVTVPGTLNSIILADDQDTYWIVVSALSTDVPGREFPIAAFQVLVVDTGANPNPPQNVSAPTYYTAAQCDARFVMIGGMAGYLPLAAGSAFPLTGTLYTRSDLAGDAVAFGHGFSVGVGSGGTDLEWKVSGTAWAKLLSTGELQVQKLQLLNAATGQTRTLTVDANGEVSGL